MPRKPRIEYPGAFYHVYSRGNRREKVFLSVEDYWEFETLLLRASDWSIVHLYAWCLMPNHFHLLVETPDGNLSQFMRRLLTAYARYFNRSHKLVGHVFQGRYHSIVCDKDPYLLELVRYIHLNPVKVKGKALCEKPEDWHSSHRYYLADEKPGEIKKSVDRVLQRFGSTPGESVLKYREFIQEGMRPEHFKRMEPVADRFLGDEHFVEEVKKANCEPVRNVVREIKSVKSVQELSNIVQRIFGVSEKELCCEGKNRRVSGARKALIYVGRNFFRFPAVRLARYLNRDITTISQTMRRMKAGSEVKELSILLDGLKP